MKAIVFAVALIIVSAPCLSAEPTKPISPSWEKVCADYSATTSLVAKSRDLGVLQSEAIDNLHAKHGYTDRAKALTGTIITLVYDHPEMSPAVLARYALAGCRDFAVKQ